MEIQGFARPKIKDQGLKFEPRMRPILKSESRILPFFKFESRIPDVFEIWNQTPVSLLQGPILSKDIY